MQRIKDLAVVGASHRTSGAGNAVCEADTPSRPDERAIFGCFSYVSPFQRAPDVRLHFENKETSGFGPLSAERMPVRRSELCELFRHVRRFHPEAVDVVGGSWLYNLDAYRRIFPPVFTQNPEPGGYETKFFALWGQFLDRLGGLRQPVAGAFIERVRTQTDLAGCLQCFPYEVIRVRCAVSAFYDVLGS